MEGRAVNNIHARIAREIPQLARGIVWCRTCGKSQSVNSGNALARGWPKCCGYTMTIDSPQERERMASAILPPCVKG